MFFFAIHEFVFRQDAVALSDVIGILYTYRPTQFHHTYIMYLCSQSLLKTKQNDKCEVLVFANHSQKHVCKKLHNSCHDASNIK